MKKMSSRNNIVFLTIIGIVTLILAGSVSGWVSGWWTPRLRNPSGTYMGCVPGLSGPSENPPGDVYFAIVFSADRHVVPKRMAFQMYWNTYQMFSSKGDHRTVYYGEAVRISRNTWKYHLLGYIVGPHPEDDVWVANDMVWIIDDFGNLTFSSDYTEVTMDYNQAWFRPTQDVDPKDGFPEGGPAGGFWPGTVIAKRLMGTG